MNSQNDHRIVQPENSLMGGINMKKWMFFIFALCFSAGFIYSQTVNSLDEEIKKAAKEIENILEENTILLVNDFDSSSPMFSDYVSDRLTVELVNTRKFTVVDRKNLLGIREEENFQSSGDVSDESRQEEGRKLGAQSIIIGRGQDRDTYYEIQFRIMAIETGAIQGMPFGMVLKDEQFDLLMGGKKIGAGSILKDKKFVFGARAGGGMEIIALESELRKDYVGQDAVPYFNFIGSLHMAYNFTSFMAVQTEFTFIIKNGITINGYDAYLNEGIPEENQYLHDETKIKDRFTYYSLEIPLLIRFNFRPQSSLLLSGLVGPYVSIPLGDLKNEFEYPNYPLLNDSRDDNITSPVIFGVMAGVSIGYNLGPGYISAHLSFMNDFNPMSADYWGERKVSMFTRRLITAALAYEIWF
jgi:hypothetical protein